MDPTRAPGSSHFFAQLAPPRMATRLWPAYVPDKDGEALISALNCTCFAIWCYLAANKLEHSKQQHSRLKSVLLICQSFLNQANAIKSTSPRLDVQHMLESNRDCQFIENPAVHATWTDEDFIGRVSRISRRTSVLTAPLNTILRSLGLYRREWASEFHASYLHPPP